MPFFSFLLLFTLYFEAGFYSAALIAWNSTYSIKSCNSMSPKYMIKYSKLNIINKYNICKKNKGV